MGKLECSIQINCPAEMFWGGIKDSITTYPKVFPERLKSLEVIEGDGASAGTIWLFKYVEGTPDATFCKERVEVLDDANKIFVYSVIDGEVTNVYKCLKISLQVVPDGERGKVKWSAEFETASEEIRTDPNNFQQHVVESIARIDDYLLKADTLV